MRCEHFASRWPPSCLSAHTHGPPSSQRVVGSTSGSIGSTIALGMLDDFAKHSQVIFHHKTGLTATIQGGGGGGGGGGNITKTLKMYYFRVWIACGLGNTFLFPFLFFFLSSTCNMLILWLEKSDSLPRKPLQIKEVSGILFLVWQVSCPKSSSNNHSWFCIILFISMN